MKSQEQGIERIVRLARHAERRMRLDRAIALAAAVLCVAMLALLGTVAAWKVGWVGLRVVRTTASWAAVAIVMVAFVGWVRRLPPRAGARALDRFHGLDDRLSSALSFAGLSARTPFMDAAISDAIAHLEGVRPRRAVPLHVPRVLAGAGVLALALLGVGSIHVRPAPAVVHAPILEPVTLAQDDLDDVKDYLEKLREAHPSADVLSAAEELTRLADDVGAERLPRQEVFRRLAALDQRLMAGAALDPAAVKDALGHMGDRLKASELTRAAGEALSGHAPDRARDALKQAAKKLRDGAVDKAKLEQTRDALRKAAAEASERRQAIEARRQQLADEISRLRQRAGDGGTDEEQSLLQRKQRELDQLDRNLDGQRDASRNLDRLDRDLEQAAEDLAKDLGLGANDVDQAAEDLNRLDEERRSDEEKEALRQKLQEMRELVRQQGQGGKERVVRLQRFGQAARGGGQGQGQGQGPGQGPGQGGQGSQGGQPGKSGTGGSPGGGGGRQGNADPSGGKDGEGTGKGQGEMEIVSSGPGGETILMFSKGRGSSGAGSEGSGTTGSNKNWGDQHDPRLMGRATAQNMGAADTQVEGADAEGASRSQVILGAAQRGFATHRYRTVYGEYHSVAEESLARDDVPAGYRFYVKRYFELIRPRD